MVLTSDGSYRGAKTIDLKGIVDDALKQCTGVDCVLVAKRINSDINMQEGRDHWLQPLLDKASTECNPETMKAEDPLVYFIYIRFNRKTKRYGAYNCRLYGLYSLYF